MPNDRGKNVDSVVRFLRHTWRQYRRATYLDCSLVHGDTSCRQKNNRSAKTSHNKIEDDITSGENKCHQNEQKPATHVTIIYNT